MSFNMTNARERDRIECAALLERARQRHLPEAGLAWRSKPAPSQEDGLIDGGSGIVSVSPCGDPPIPLRQTKSPLKGGCSIGGEGVRQKDVHTRSSAYYIYFIFNNIYRQTIQSVSLKSNKIPSIMWYKLWDKMMKPTGKHLEKRLSATHVRAIKEPGRYADGNGLYLVVEASGNKHWVLRILVHGKRRDIGLGGLSTVSLAEARESAHSKRKLAREGGDPIAARRKKQIITPTFSDAARVVHAEHSPSWKSAKHADQWINTLTQYAFPVLGNLPVDRIETPDILRTLSTIWLTKPETARRLRQRIGTVLDWAKASGYRTGDNPVEGVTKGLPKQTDRDKHHEALPYSDTPKFIKALRTIDAAESVRLAFELLILTATRTREVLEAKWSEIDEKNKIWTIPSERMKATREHRIPLPPQCIKILKAARKLAYQSSFVFPGRSPEKPLSNMAFLMVLRRMNLKITAHGFRSSFRDWASEQTNFPHDVCEMALAHSIKNKVEAAYRRGDLFDKRRDLMAAWSTFATSFMPNQGKSSEAIDAS